MLFGFKKNINYVNSLYVNYFFTDQINIIFFLNRTVLQF